MTAVSKDYAPQLDSLRGIAALAVIFSHTVSGNYRIGDFTLIEFGMYGVQLFFVLSAYLITLQLLATEQQLACGQEKASAALVRFYIKRILRLFPAYYIAITVAAIFRADIRDEYFWHAFQLSDIFFAINPQAEETSPAGHLWTLSVEWQFYLLWPWVVLLAKRAMPWVIGLAIAVSVYSWSPIADIPEVLDRTNILQSLDSFAIGALLALAQHHEKPLNWLSKLFWPCIFIILIGLSPYALRNSDLGDGILFLTHGFMNILFAVMIFNASSGHSGHGRLILDNPALIYAGRISYGVYVYHLFLLAFYVDFCRYMDVTPFHWGLRLFGLLTVMTFIVASLSWYFIESPINALRGRLRAPPKPTTLANTVS